MNENINEFDLNDIIGKIKVMCPTHKVNFDKEDKFHVAGMYLCLCDDVKKEMNCDLSDLNDDTYLFIDKRTLVEYTQVIDGCLQLLVNNNIIDKTQRNCIIGCILNTSIITFEDLKDITHDIIYNNIENKDNKIINNIEYIMNYIWFLPYTEIDIICQKALQEYKDNGDKNE